MYKNKRTKLGFIGIGLMGKPMVMRLLMAEYQVFVWNRSQPALAEVASAGATPCATPAAVAEQADVILLCLANTRVVEDVIDNPSFLEALRSNAGKIIVDHSSISPQVTARLASLVDQQGQASWIDAPVSGGVDGAEKGTLVVMAGGDPSVIDNIQPITSVLASRVTRMGPNGSGQAAKLCNQVIVGCNISAIAEAIRLAQSAGVEASRLPAALAGGFADSLPFQIFGQRMSEGQEQPVSIKIETMLKDLDGALEVAEMNGTRIELTETAAALMRGRSDNGDAERCITSLVYPPQSEDD